MEKIEIYEKFLDSDITSATFEILSTQIKWHEELTSTETGSLVKIKRKMAYVSDVDGFIYNYADLSFPGQAWIPQLELLRDKLNEFTNRNFNSVLLNWYKDGKDIIGWHSDKEEILKGGLEGSVIGCVNLGATRNFLFRKKSSYEQKDIIIYPVSDGDLLMMNAGCQAEYLHAILKEAGVEEPRISLTFREV